MKIDNKRFAITKISKNSKRVKDLPINNEVFCEFYVRLFSLLGKESHVSYEGFSFLIVDNQNGLYFEAGLTGFGGGYFAENDDKQTISIINEFHEILYSSNLKLKECSITYVHDFGTSTFSYKDHKFHCTEEYD